MRQPLCLVAAFAFCSLSALAVTITFEGASNSIYSSPIVRSGFTIGNPIGDEQHFHEITSTGFGLPNNGTGVLLNDRDTRIYVAQGGTAFTLGSVDVAAALDNSPGVGITITGYLLGAPTGTVDLADFGLGYTTLLGATLGSVDYLLFDGIGGQGGFVLDNLVLNESVQQEPVGEVPEPATVTYLCAGLLALSIARSRK